MRALVLVAAFALSACGPMVVGGGGEQTEAETTTTAPATPSGPPAQVAIAPGEHPEAYVTETVFLPNAPSGAKVYSVAGGDPAINGLYTYIAAYNNEPGGGWNVFQIGDFNSWSVAEDRGSEIVLAVSRSQMGQNGDIETLQERYIVSVPDADDTSITITPAT